MFRELFNFFFLNMMLLLRRETGIPHSKTPPALKVHGNYPRDAKELCSEIQIIARETAELIALAVQNFLADKPSVRPRFWNEGTAPESIK